MAGFSRGVSTRVLSSSYLSNVDCDDDIDVKDENADRKLDCDDTIDFKDENADRKLDCEDTIDFQDEIAGRETDYDAKREIRDDEQGEKAYERERELYNDDDSESEHEYAEREMEYGKYTDFLDEHEERFYDDDSRIEDENADWEMEDDNYTDFLDEHEERFYDDDSRIEDENADWEMEYDYCTDFEDENEKIIDDYVNLRYAKQGWHEYELDEILEHETSILALLRGQNLAVYNSDGTLRCPLSPSRKKQAYSYKGLLQHATAVVSDLRTEREEAGKHSALKAFLEPNLLSSSTRPLERPPKVEQNLPPRWLSLPTHSLFLKVEQNLPPGRKVEDMLVCPWSVVIYNIDNSTVDPTKPEDWVRDGKRELKLYFADFNPVQIEFCPFSVADSGACVLQFGRDLSGLIDAQALEKSFIDHKHGFRDYKRHLDSCDVGQEFYGWLAREDDYMDGWLCDRGGNETGRYLRKAGSLKDCQLMHNQQVRQLAATVAEKSEESQDLKTELEINLWRAEAERLQMEKSHKIELEAVRVEAIEEAYNQANLETTRALEKREAELRQLDKELREKESHINAAAEENRLQAQAKENRQLREALANQKVLLQHKEAEKIKLLQNHEEETRRLVDHAQKEAQKLAKWQQIKMERGQLQTKLETGKLFDTIKQDLGHERKKMEELEKKLAELQSTQEYQEETITTLTVKERESNDEIVDGREIAVQVIQVINEAKRLIEAALKKKDQLDKIKQPQPRVEVKRAGAIDDTAWSKALKRKHKNDANWGVKMREVFSTWEARIRSSEFQPFKTVQIGEDKWEQQINDENGELASLKKMYGKEVYNSVTTALMEIEEYNASDRYPVPVAWNFKKSRKASVKEVIQYLGRIIDSLVAPEVFAYLGRTIESLMAPGAPRKRSRNL